MKKPYKDFFSGKFYDYRVTHDYKHGIRHILSIEYELPCGKLLSADDKWTAPIVSFKITCGWLMFNGWILWGRVKESGFNTDEEEYENSSG